MTAILGMDVLRTHPKGSDCEMFLGSPKNEHERTKCLGIRKLQIKK